MKAKFFAFGLIAAFVAQSALGVTYDDLTPAQKTKIGNGEIVAITHDVAGKPWPEVWVFLRIHSTPEEAMAVFSDVNRHKEYLPNITESKITKKLSKSSFQADYTLDLPFPLSDEHYTVENKLSSHSAVYRMEWKLVRADTTKQSDGYSDFSALGTETLLTYYNIVVPGSSFAGAIKDQAEKQVRDVAAKLRDRVGWEISGHQDLLRQQIEALQTAIEN